MTKKPKTKAPAKAPGRPPAAKTGKGAAKVAGNPKRPPAAKSGAPAAKPVLPWESDQWTVTMRPRKLSDMMLPADASSAIKRIIDGKLRPTAVLLVGSTGVGKTTIARIISQGLTKGDASDETYHHCGADNGIASIRILIDNSAYMPSVSGGRRVVILDEVHKLTGAALDSLLTVMETTTTTTFILCTDQPGKLKKAMSDRAVVIRLRPPEKSVLVDGLTALLAKTERLTEWTKASRDELVSVVATTAAGSVRHAVQVLQAAVEAADEEGATNVKALQRKRPDLMTAVNEENGDGYRIAARISTFVMADKAAPPTAIAEAIADLASLCAVASAIEVVDQLARNFGAAIGSSSSHAQLTRVGMAMAAMVDVRDKIMSTPSASDYRSETWQRLVGALLPLMSSKKD